MTRGLDNKEDPIEVQIANIVPMMMANMKNPGTFNFVSGIDRFFLAPELNLNEVGQSNDVWSICSMLYMMVTGGFGNKENAQAFTFPEEIWNTATEQLREFLRKGLVVKAKERSSIDDLLSTDFMEGARNSTLRSTERFETKLTSQGYNLYQFQWAYCINEIIAKFQDNWDKLSKINDLRATMLIGNAGELQVGAELGKSPLRVERKGEKSPKRSRRDNSRSPNRVLEGAAQATRDRSGSSKVEKKIQAATFFKTIKDTFGEIEAIRIERAFKTINHLEEFTFE